MINIKESGNLKKTEHDYLQKELEQLKSFCAFNSKLLHFYETIDFLFKALLNNSNYEVGWHEGNSGKSIHPLSQKQPNEFGIYNLTGALNEWTSDFHQECSGEDLFFFPKPSNSEKARMIRDKSEDSCYNSNLLPKTRRSYAMLDSKSNLMGFRLVLNN
jgi:formylglycine-generating enzyme required for sulfatase activity